MSMDAQLAHPPTTDLLDGYSPAGGAFDEMMDPSGQVRPHWQPFIAKIGMFDRAARSALSDRLNRRVREIGIAHDAFADPDAVNQPWRVDLVPLLISAEEWRWLERAMIQRASLLNAVLADVYGAQTLLATGKIPPGLVFSARTYLRACQNTNPEGGHLQFYAADLARGPDGHWRVIDNHTETPAGTGYALANRIVHTHVAGDMFASANAVRLAPFFRKVQAALIRRSGRTDPRIVLLTPGPHHEDYFSHAYLARYLGFLLAEGSDLRVAGDQVYLKTLEGLRPVDLIVRCVEGAMCDPLELDPQGFLGPGGLLQAYRKAPHHVVNSIGSALVENRGLGSYLPALCEALLGEPLMLPDAPRWWLGDAAARARVLRDPDRMVIRAAHEGTGRPGRASLGTNAASLSPAERALLLAEIELHGDELVAEETVGFGTVPSWTPQGLRPHAFAVRFFAAATRNGYRVMPGGLAMTIDSNRSVALNAPDGDTRDVWVLSDTAMAPHTSLWRPALETAMVQRSQRDLQSRVADNLFWLGRYAERADWTMRVLRSALVRHQVDSGQLQSQRAAVVCLQNLLAKDRKTKTFPSAGGDQPGVETLVRTLTTSKGGDFSLARTLESLHQVASLTRDRLSLEAWRTLNAFRPGEGLRQTGPNVSIGETLDLLEEGLSAIAAFNGLMHENMTRNFGWSFLDMGRRLERAVNLCEAVTSLFEGNVQSKDVDVDEDTDRLMFLLEVADSFITYRSRYRLDPMVPLVLDLLLIDESNPRSLVFQLAALSRHLETLPQALLGITLTEERRLILALHSQMRLADVQAMADRDGHGLRSHLCAMMSEQETKLPELSNAIMRRYFSLKDEQPHRVHTRARPRQ